MQRVGLLPLTDVYSFHAHASDHNIKYLKVCYDLNNGAIVLGKGTYCTVFDARNHNTDDRLALKVPNSTAELIRAACLAKISEAHCDDEALAIEQFLDQNDSKDAEFRALSNEVTILNTIKRSPRIVNALVFATSDNTNVAPLLVMPQFPSTLTSLIHSKARIVQDESLGSFTSPSALLVRLVSQLLDAVEAMHSSGYAHIDIKSSNILCTSDTLECCLCDLGSSCLRDAPIPLRGITSNFAPNEFQQLRVAARKNNAAPHMLSDLDFDVFTHDYYSVAMTFIFIMERAAPQHHHTRIFHINDLRKAIDTDLNAYAQERMIPTQDPSNIMAILCHIVNPHATQDDRREYFAQLVHLVRSTVA